MVDERRMLTKDSGQHLLSPITVPSEADEHLQLQAGLLKAHYKYFSFIILSVKT